MWFCVSDGTPQHHIASAANACASVSSTTPTVQKAPSLKLCPDMRPWHLPRRSSSLPSCSFLPFPGSSSQFLRINPTPLSVGAAPERTDRCRSRTDRPLPLKCAFFLLFPYTHPTLQMDQSSSFWSLQALLIAGSSKPVRQADGWWCGFGRTSFCQAGCGKVGFFLG
jgi:hypothetical protein